jgi:peptide/nickel transport system substrate-binding protein
VPADQLARLQQDYPQLQVFRYPSRRFDFVGWNNRRPLLADAEVRRALTMAIDCDEIIATVWGGQAQRAKGPVLPVLWAYDDGIELLPFDPERAAALLAAKGWVDSDGDGIRDRDGREFSIEIVTNNTSQQRVDVCTLVQGYLRNVGVEVRIRTFDFSTFLAKVQDCDYDACVLQLKLSTKLDLTDEWHSGAVPPNGYNVSFYQNPEVDRLIEEARVCLDPERARTLWSQAQRTIYRDQPVTFIGIPDEINVLNERFCNVRPNAISFFANLRHWRVAPDCD